MRARQWEPSVVWKCNIYSHSFLIIIITMTVPSSVPCVQAELRSACRVHVFCQNLAGWIFIVTTAGFFSPSVKLCVWVDLFFILSEPLCETETQTHTHAHLSWTWVCWLCVDHWSLIRCCSNRKAPPRGHWFEWKLFNEQLIIYEDGESFHDFLLWLHPRWHC